MDHVERLLAFRELRAIVDVYGVRSLGDYMWPGVPEASAGVTLCEFAMWWSRQSSPGIVKKGNQRQVGIDPKVSEERRRRAVEGCCYMHAQSWKYLERTPCDLEILAPKAD